MDFALNVPMQAQETQMIDRSNSSRRVFMMQAATVAGSVLWIQEASAQAMVAENDPQAAAIGYKADATKVDKSKYAKYAAGQTCGSCTLYQGKSGAASGVCGMFPGKQVAAGGWCSAWVKKA